jgi:probable F420-dependent oxidoreductase
VRYGFKTAPMNTTWPAMLDVWRAADDLEIFESGWNFDHFEPIFSDRSGPCLEGWSMLAAMAAATSRVRLGCQVSGMPYRHPSVLANIAATVDVISDGRLIIGLGAGWNQEESDALGIRLPPLKERFDQFEEGVQVIVALLSDERATFKGEHFTLTDAWCEPKPVQRPHPPIWMGVGHPDAVRRTASIADGWMGSGGSRIADFAASVPILRAALEEKGRDPIAFPTSKRIFMAVDERPEMARHELLRWFTDVYRNPPGVDLCGIHGTPEQVRERLEEVVAMGANHLLLNPVSNHAEQVEALAEVVGLK